MQLRHTCRVAAATCAPAAATAIVGIFCKWSSVLTFECKPKTLHECAAYFTATGKDNTCTSCGEHCNQDQCMTIYGSYPGSGNSVCCPAGMEQRGDGSACQGGGQTACKLFSNPNLPLCSSASTHGTQLVECAAGSCGSCFTAKDTTQDNTCTSCGDNEHKEDLNAETACTQHGS